MAGKKTHGLWLDCSSLDFSSWVKVGQVAARKNKIGGALFSSCFTWILSTHVFTFFFSSTAVNEFKSKLFADAIEDMDVSRENELEFLKTVNTVKGLF